VKDNVTSDLEISPVVAVPAEAVRESLSQRAYRQIRSALTSSAMRPGHRLILRPLAHSLDLSPTPVREALLRLVSEQALALDERGSAIVPITTIESFRELSQMRGDLEARAAERAVEFATDAQIDALEAINAVCIDAFERNEHHAVLEQNAMFHRGLCKAGRSALILCTLEGLWMRLGPIYTLSFEQPLPNFGAVGHPHEHMVAALRARDPVAARAAALYDVMESNRILEPMLQA
jgi:DNA-binding GntR family transcriptional regulator